MHSAVLCVHVDVDVDVCSLFFVTGPLMRLNVMEMVGVSIFSARHRYWYFHIRDIFCLDAQH
jgi:hypothetical protein